MRFMVLACDYDGTIATAGRVGQAVVAALERCRESGRKLVLVTGRETMDLLEICPHLELFEWVVAENGAVLYQPATQSEKLLASPPPDAFVQALRQRGVSPCVAGSVIVAALAEQATIILETIREFGLELHVAFNKESAMVLPLGIHKASGLLAALDQMRISPHNTVAIGDAENDQMLLAHCAAGVAVANAIEGLKMHADLVTKGASGAGVAELIERLLADDLASLEPQLARNKLLLGRHAEGRERRIEPHRTNLARPGNGDFT